MNGTKKSTGLIRSIIISVAITIAVALTLISVIGFTFSYTRTKSDIQTSVKQSITIYREKMDAWLSEQATFCEAQATADLTTSSLTRL